MEAMRSDNHNEAITTHLGVSILVPCRKSVPASARDGVAYERTKTLAIPVSRPVMVAVADADELKDVDLLKRIDPLEDLLADFELAEAIESKDRPRAKAITLEKLGRAASERPEQVFAQRMSAGLEGTRFVIWRDDSSGRLRPGILCETATQAAYALLVEHLGRPGGWSVCRRCGKVFRKRRARQPYCSGQCRVNDGMRRYRQRKAKLRKKGRRAKR